MSTQLLARLGCAIALCLGLSSVAGAQQVETLATGLNNPRGLGFAPNGELYVAEMGNGGPGPCIPSPAAPVNRCYGETGSIARIEPHAANGFVRILTGLPSLGLPTGAGEGGVADISFHGMNAMVQIGFGGNPAQRSVFGDKGQLFGSLLKVKRNGRYRVVADVSGHEITENPYGGAIDTNPYGVLALPGRTIVADAGANALIEVRANGHMRTLATLSAVAPGNRDPVPTGVAEGLDGALYVSQLTGFPFFEGTSSVLRVESDGSSIQAYASGFTTAVDVAVDCWTGALYVLEVAKGQVGPFPPPNFVLGQGRLVRQCPGSATRDVLLSNLSFPNGVAVGPDGAIYLTNNGTSATAGAVLKLTVAPCN